MLVVVAAVITAVVSAVVIDVSIPVAVVVGGDRLLLIVSFCSLFCSGVHGGCPLQLWPIRMKRAIKTSLSATARVSVRSTEKKCRL